MFNSNTRFLICVGISLLSAGSVAPPAWATPKAAIAVVEVLSAANPEQLALRDASSSSEIALAKAQGSGLETVKLGDELSLAVKDALKAKGIVAYVAGDQNHPWPTSSLQLSIDETRYERRLEGKIGPNLQVRFRLYDSNSRDRLVGDTYVYDMYAKTIGRSIVRPPAEFGFEKYEELKSHHDIMLAALRKGVDMIADQIATDILADIED